MSFEFWTKHIVGSGQDGIHPWIHWVFPKTVWQLGDNTFEEGDRTPDLERVLAHQPHSGATVPTAMARPTRRTSPKAAGGRRMSIRRRPSCDFADVTPSS